MVRLSITLPEDLWEQAKDRAVDERREGKQAGRPSLNAVIVAALREYLVKYHRAKGRR